MTCDNANSAKDRPNGQRRGLRNCQFRNLNVRERAIPNLYFINNAIEPKVLRKDRFTKHQISVMGRRR